MHIEKAILILNVAFCCQNKVLSYYFILLKMKLIYDSVNKKSERGWKNEGKREDEARNL